MNIMLRAGPSSVARRAMGTGILENLGVEVWRDIEGRGYSFSLPQINLFLPQMLNLSYTKNRLLLFDQLLYSRLRESVSYLSVQAPLVMRIPYASVVNSATV